MPRTRSSLVRPAFPFNMPVDHGRWIVEKGGITPGVRGDTFIQKLGCIRLHVPGKNGRKQAK